jgi:hypothetical protein
LPIGTRNEGDGEFQVGDVTGTRYRADELVDEKGRGERIRYEARAVRFSGTGRRRGRRKLDL